VRALLEQREEKASELARSNAELEQFAYIASHDLQEPLRMVTSYLQLLEKRHAAALNEQAKHYMHTAVDGAKRMQDLIHGILQYSRVTSQRMERETVELSLALADVLGVLRAQIMATGARIEHRGLPAVQAVPIQLIQLLQNLIANAIKFRSGEPPSIVVSASDSGAYWTIAVSDNGIGIRAEDQGRLFKIFQRLHTLDEYPGSGIGLATCKKIVESHGGRIWVESGFGEGSTFRFTLPKVHP
jgi:light-regulated signal transduction histidine kinase (bacteriophytochrome)